MTRAGNDHNTCQELAPAHARSSGGGPARGLARTQLAKETRSSATRAERPGRIQFHLPGLRCSLQAPGGRPSWAYLSSGAHRARQSNNVHCDSGISNAGWVKTNFRRGPSSSVPDSPTGLAVNISSRRSKTQLVESDAERCPRQSLDTCRVHARASHESITNFNQVGSLASGRDATNRDTAGGRDESGTLMKAGATEYDLINTTALADPLT